MISIYSNSIRLKSRMLNEWMQLTRLLNSAYPCPEMSGQRAMYLLRKTNGLNSLFQMTAAQLRAISADNAEISMLHSVREIFYTLSENRIETEEYLRSSEDVCRYVQNLYGPKRREHLLAIYLSNKLKILDIVEVSAGEHNRVDVSNREILSYALSVSATNIILCHNHPSGDPMPSSDDFTVTTRLRDACANVGIKLLDHLILTQSRYVSMKDVHREIFSND